MERPSDCVRVAVRVRPLNAREHLAGSTEVVIVGDDERSLLVAPDRSFAFDRVFSPLSTQVAIFTELAQPTVDAWLAGYNCTILAYGQTGSGKTFTMGTSWMDGPIGGTTSEDELGIVPRAVSLLMQRLRDEVDVNRGESFELYASFLELYNEELVDLLNTQSTDRHDRSKRPVINIREDPTGLICVTGVREETVRNEDEILELLRRGSLCRTTKSTDMNLVSSRSHAIFTLLLKQQRAGENDGEQRQLFSKLHFVDLAGSERLKRTNVVGERARESICINSGLLALGNVISALGDESRRATHIPYRDSKLTRLLQDSLGGNSQTLMIACISPSSDNRAETLNTLKYAHRAKNIRNVARPNEEREGSQAWEIMQLRKQVASLKGEILQLRGLGIRGRSEGPESRGSMATASNDGEVTRLRIQIRELQRQCGNLAREKIAIEAERDFYRQFAGNNSATSTSISSLPGTAATIDAIKGHLQTIADLRVRIATLETNNRRASVPMTAAKTGTTGGPLGPPGRNRSVAKTTTSSMISETPAWFNKANELIDRTREEIRHNEAFIETLRRRDEDTAEFPDEVIETLVNNQTLKEELLVSLENSQQDYLLMRRKYEERLRLLQENIFAIQRERDQAIQRVSTHNAHMAERRGGLTQGRLEDRIRQLGRTIEELKARNAEYSREIGTRTGTQETLLRNLRTALQTARSEKIKLQSRIDELAGRLQASMARETGPEMSELRARERRSEEQAKRYRKAYEFQRTLLHKRSEQYLQAKARIRLLVNAVRKHRVPLSPSIGSLLETPSLKNLLHHHSQSQGGGNHLATGISTPTPLNRIRPPQSNSLLASRVISVSDLGDDMDNPITNGNSPDEGQLGPSMIKNELSDKDYKIDAEVESPPSSAMVLPGLKSTPLRSKPPTSEPHSTTMETPRRNSSIFGTGRFIAVPSPMIHPHHHSALDIGRLGVAPSPSATSALKGRGRDLFSRLADAASLNLATRQSYLLGSETTSNSTGKGGSSMSHSHDEQSTKNSSPPSFASATAAALATSPMKVDSPPSMSHP